MRECLLTLKDKGRGSRVASTVLHSSSSALLSASRLRSHSLACCVAGDDAATHAFTTSLCFTDKAPSSCPACDDRMFTTCVSITWSGVSMQKHIVKMSVKSVSCSLIAEARLPYVS